MTYDRRDRRPGGGRPSGGRPGGGRPDRPPRAQEGFGGPPRGAGYGQRGPGGGRSFDRGGSFVPRTRDEGGMSIRLDPRRLAALKLLAGEEGLRPGELVTRWVEERLDAARSGQPQAPAAGATSKADLAALTARIDDLARRLDALSTAAPASTAPLAGADSGPVASKRRGRPPKSATPPRANPAGPRVPLHEEIIAVISERGPSTAAELASAIQERGRYTNPRSAKPFDASTVNARVSNPAYRSRFTRDKGRIGLANAG